MKKIKLLLITITLISCNNNSFEKYNEWCNEVITKEKILFNFDLTVELPYIINESNGDTLENGIRFGSGTNYTYRTIRDTDIEELNYFLSKEYYRLSSLEYKRVHYQASRCKPTIEGYNEWLKTQ